MTASLMGVVPIWQPWLTLTASLKAGMLQTSAVQVASDAFIGGGPFSVRGTAYGSLGPRHNGTSIGGRRLIEAGLGMRGPIYINDGTKNTNQGAWMWWHAFANAGLVTDAHKAELEWNWKWLQDRHLAACSMGVGLTAAFGGNNSLSSRYEEDGSLAASPTKIELNALWMPETQTWKMHFGIGTEFL